ncbi:MAG: M3 family metallopeptidase [Dokdonia sp.]|jgi:peptidyl-dipeptidase Dcp
MTDISLTSNPLLQPFDEAPFSKIEHHHFQPAIEEAIRLGRKEIDNITNQTAAPTFDNTIAALDYAAAQLDRVSSIFFNLNSAETNEEIQEIAQRVSPLLTEFGNDITLNEALFARIKKIYAQKDALDLSEEQKTLLEKKYKSFSRNGANLSEDKKNRLRQIDTQLAKLSLQFGENVLADTNAFELHLTQEDQLAGLPDSAKEAAAALAKSQDKEGWLITLDYPSYIPFMKYAQRRDLRKKLSLAFGSRAFHDDDNDNQNNVLEIANLRHERAQLLGYKTHAHFVLEQRMAKTPEKVTSFLENLLAKAKPAAQREFAELSNFAQSEDGIDALQKWDGAFYAEKLKKQLFDLDDEALKPYFKLENVIAGVFTVAEKLFGLQFKAVDDVEVYHQDVKTYRVYDQDERYIALFYADFHPRKGKRGGAWMTSFKGQMIKDGVNHRPHISNVCNFTPSTPTKPSLLTFNEVTTLFHEFGHGLHGMLANTTYPSLSGTSVFWDFVELPSQVLENWCYQQEALELFAHHYDTGEVIPMELIQKIKASATFHEGMQTMRQLSFGMLDMAWHGSDPSTITNVKAFETAAFAPTRLYPETPETCMSTSFSHIFQGGYAAGYYSYKWAEVLDADAFEFFSEQGIFNSAIGSSFREHVLSKGGTEDPMLLYKRFRGQEPQADALLRRAGLIEKK